MPAADATLMLDLAAEGDCVTVYGRLDRGRWRFWTEGVSYNMDTDERRAYRSEPAADLLALLPDFWPVLVPGAVHSVAAARLRAAYPAAVASLPDHLRAYQQQRRDRDWRQALGMTEPTAVRVVRTRPADRG